VRETSHLERWGIAVVLVLLLAGCGSAPAPQVATAHPSAGVASVPPSSVAPRESDYDKALRYTRCMTANGAPVADPVEGKELPTGETLVRGDTFDTNSPRRVAYQKCKQFLPATWPIKLDPKEVARSHGYVQCMRKRGIPEPVADENDVVNEPTDNRLFRIPGYEAAVAACRHLVDDPANNDPANK
jgi:hypothetical protein